MIDLRLGDYRDVPRANAGAWLNAVWPMWRDDYAYMGERVEIPNEPSDPAVVIS